MFQPAPTSIISHWYNLIGDFSYSTKEYYQQIEEALSQLQVPGLKVSRVEWKEGGMFSAKREYLRIRRDRLVFDICGAPFGTGYFVSWWLGQLRLANIFVVLGVLSVLFIAGFAALGWIDMLFYANWAHFMDVAQLRAAMFPGWRPIQFVLSSYFPGLITLLGLPLLFLLLYLFVRSNPMGIEDTIIEIPYIGLIYERLFRPITYYRIDTALMFQSAVHSVVLQVVDQITQAQGLRTLSPDERKPIMREFYQK